MGRREREPPPLTLNPPPPGAKEAKGAKGAGAEVGESHAGSMSHGFKMAAVKGVGKRLRKRGKSKSFTSPS